jgi:hypothetical protein
MRSHGAEVGSEDGVGVDHEEGGAPEPAAESRQRAAGAEELSLERDVERDGREAPGQRALDVGLDGRREVVGVHGDAADAGPDEVGRRPVQLRNP